MTKNSLLSLHRGASFAVPLTAALSFSELIAKIQNEILKPIITLLFSLATVVFMWGIIAYVINGGNADRAGKAKTVILWGIIGMALMLGAWGIVRIICGFFGPDACTMDPLGGGGPITYKLIARELV
ncbi:MAG: hypothetical protein U1A26_03340 [Candidatus Sungbacteria bacterium]|nr:hypothetical protein [Candidatus Sungbacteria bacterium]